MLDYGSGCKADANSFLDNLKGLLTTILLFAVRINSETLTVTAQCVLERQFEWRNIIFKMLVQFWIELAEKPNI